MNFLGYAERLDILERIHQGQSSRHIAREGGYGPITVRAVAERAGVMATLLWHLIDGEPPEGPFGNRRMSWREATEAIRRIVPRVLAEYLDPCRPIEPYTGRSAETYVPARRRRSKYFSNAEKRDQARRMVERGCDDQEVAAATGFSRTTVYYWRTRFGWNVERPWVLLPHVQPDRSVLVSRIQPPGPTPLRRCEACLGLTSVTPCLHCNAPWALSA